MCWFMYWRRICMYRRAFAMWRYNFTWCDFFYRLFQYNHNLFLYLQSVTSFSVEIVSKVIRIAITQFLLELWLHFGWFSFGGNYKILKIFHFEQRFVSLKFAATISTWTLHHFEMSKLVFIEKNGLIGQINYRKLRFSFLNEFSIEIK